MSPACWGAAHVNHYAGWQPCYMGGLYCVMSLAVHRTSMLQQQQLALKWPMPRCFCQLRWCITYGADLALTWLWQLLTWHTALQVLAFSLVHPEHRDARLYAGDTAELLHNMTRDLVKTQQVSDLALCGAYLSSGGGVNGGSGGGNGGNGVRRLLQEGAEQEGPQKTVMPWPGPAVPGEVDCGMRKPGVRCSRDPCQDASCPGEPAAACVPFYCQEPRWFRGVHVTQQPCSAVFVDRSFGDVVDCSTAAKPLPAHRNPSGDPPEVSGSSKNGGSGSNSASVSGGDRLPVKLPIKSSRTMGSISGNRTAPSLQTYAMGEYSLWQVACADSSVCDTSQ